MKLRKWIDTSTWVILPTLLIHKDDPWYVHQHIRISFHWLIFNIGI